MKLALSSRATDLIVNTASAALAGGCAFFAGVMILRLENMEHPPADLGLNFKSMDKQQVAVDVEKADSQITGSTSRTARPAGTTAKLPRNEPAVLDFRLLSVIDGLAFVEVSGPGGKEIWPVGKDDMLPGAGRILKIEHDQNRWQVFAARMVITGERQ